MHFLYLMVFISLCSNVHTQSNGAQKPLLGLVMIVKDEAHGIEILADSVRPYIDRWTILDTGSTDGTQEIIKKAFEGIPGQLYQEPFVDFAASRNRVLELTEDSTIFVLMMDGEEALVNGHILREVCEREKNAKTPAYFMEIKDSKYGRNWWNPFLIRTQSGCRYHGKVHEHLDGIDQQVRITDVYIAHNSTQKGDARTEKRLKNDCQILEQEVIQNPKDYRVKFYLAQTYSCLGQNRKAYDLYTQCLYEYGDMISYEAAFRRAVVGEKLLSFHEMIQHYLQASACGPHRAEPLYIVAKLYKERGEYMAAFPFALRAARLPKPKDTLGIYERVYDYLVFDLLGIVAWHVGEFTLGEQATRKALEINPGDFRLHENLALYQGRKNQS